MSTPALTVIGLDAATPGVVETMIEAGELPNLARLGSLGCRGVLRSTLHPLTPQAWTTMVTGVNAGRHGVWDFTERDPSGYRLKIVNGSRRRVPALWDYLHAQGLACGIVNVPFTAPAPEVDGFVVAGMDAAPLDEAMTFPRDLAATLRRRFGTLALDHGFPLDDNGSVSLDLIRQACSQRVEMTRWLRDRFEPDLLFVVFMSADHIHHLCWPEWETRGLESRVADVYRILDGAVGALVDAADSNVLVVSDHGGGRLDGVVNLNAWLSREGFLSYAARPGRLSREHASRRVAGVLDGLRSRVPRDIREYVRRRAPGVRRRVHQLHEHSVIDWHRTRAFAYGTFGSIVVNLRGREQYGTVDPGDYEKVREDIAQCVMHLEDPDGLPIVSAVHRREDLFHGTELGSLPDLIIEFDDYRWLGKGNMQARADSLWDTIEITQGSTESYVGSHRRNGFISVSGPAAARGRALSASIEDVAPTVLYLLGLPIPEGLEGRVLEEALNAELLDRRPPVYEAYASARAPGSSTASGSPEVEERLRSLGYLE